MRSVPLVFVTYVPTDKEQIPAQMLIDSLRNFGGELWDTPFWIFTPDNGQQIKTVNFPDQTEVITYQVNPSQGNYLFSDKVTICALAEKIAESRVDSLVWIDPVCLFLNEPKLFKIENEIKAAFRPVHIQNVGLKVNETVDWYWKRIFETVGIDDISSSVDSFVDQQHLRSYFNSHSFCFSPNIGLMKKWLETFEILVNDKNFQGNIAFDQRHRIFLFQAILSTILANELKSEEIRILPPSYNYPFHLQGQIPQASRITSVSDLVILAYEELSVLANNLPGIQTPDAFKEWFAGWKSKLN
jgi:hypothetical protein